MQDYLGGAVPALLYYAHFESRTKEDRVIELPDLKAEALLPLWQLAKLSMKKGDASLSFVLGMHAALLSVARVNGDRGCLRISITLKSCLFSVMAQMGASAPVYREKSPEFLPNLAYMQSWVEQVHKRANVDPFFGQNTLLAVLAKRQRDHTLLMNPYIAGQQLLVLTLAVSFACGMANVDCLGQTRTLLHIYNALLSTGFEQCRVPLLDTLLEALASSKTLFFAGRPSRNFLQHWHFCMGMSTNSKIDAPNRKLEPYEPAGISPAYRRAADVDFADLEAGAVGVAPVAQLVREAFASDALTGFNFFALGALFTGVLSSLVDALGLREQVDEKASKIRVENTTKRRGKGKRSTGIPPESRATNEILVNGLLFDCELCVTDLDAPWATPRDFPVKLTRAEYVKTMPANRARLELAAATIRQLVELIPESKYRLPL